MCIKMSRTLTLFNRLNSRCTIQRALSSTVSVSNNNDLINANILNGHKSTLYSNFSLMQILALMYNGTSCQQTLQAYKSLFQDVSADQILTKFKNINQSLTNIGIANSIWINKNTSTILNPKFLEYVSDLCHIESVSFFEAQPIINAWITKQTRGMIRTIPISTQGQLALVNTVHFKDTWVEQFNPKNTIHNIFDISHDTYVYQEFMTQRTYCPMYQDDHYSILGKPYKHGSILYIMLPKHGYKVCSIDTEQLSKYYTRLEYQDTYMEIPKFTIQATHNMASILTSVGLNCIVQGPYDTICNTQLSVSQMIQTVKITIDEIGTEAAASTISQMRESSIIKHNLPQRFIANRPFAYFIVHDISKTVLFNGVYYG